MICTSNFIHNNYIIQYVCEKSPALELTKERANIENLLRKLY